MADTNDPKDEQDTSQEQGSHVEDNEATTASGDEESHHEEELSDEDLRKALEATRKEAAKRRVQAQKQAEELEALRAKAAEAKSKDEVDKLMADYQEQLAAAARETDRLRAALHAGLGEDMADRIRGDDYDAMLEDAKTLAEMVGVGRQAPEPRIPGGGRNPKPPTMEEMGADYKRAKARHRG